MDIQQSESEIREQIDWCRYSDTGEVANQYPGMTYAEGVEDALQWILGERDDAPIESDPGKQHVEDGDGDSD